MRAANVSEYTDHPIFLHILNRELHDAIGKPVDIDEILGAIQVFSVVSSQMIFCNVSQIHEILYDQSNVLEEVLELSKIGRFVDHSDYGSYQEFRESRAEIFSHSAHLHPGFFLEPKPELKRLLHGSMGDAVSTTGHIQDNLRRWLESDPSSALGNTLSQNDARVLRANESWIDRTLSERDQKALTYDVFEQMASRQVERNAEGAIRRSLTELYIDSYLKSFNARCLWGFRGKNHFERSILLAGLHQQFATMILEQVGIAENLRKTAHFGRLKRITSDKQDEAAYFRQGYAEFATMVDSRVEDPLSWHNCNMVITAAIQKTRSSGVLRPQKAASSYRDILLRAGDVLSTAAREGSSQRPPQSIKTYAVATPNTIVFAPKTQINFAAPASPDTAKDVLRPNIPWYHSYVVLVALGGILIGVASHLAWPAFFDWQESTRWIASVLSVLSGGALIFIFHPDFFHRRMVFYGLVISAAGGLSYRLELDGWLNQLAGSFEIGNLPSQTMIIGGLLFAGLNVFLDAKTRWKRDRHG
ncbi:hypothetical protein [Phaeobacter inhibens]|uniref:hypothetical protein n=1 Tax=Phaeobacter inhibens TaxID=221822 RepID=UPI0021A4BB38|nr:hypothetical protein [Phaeobacter inhibens]UWR48397.1 hypothetical protein K4F87_13915 [Phaeobacter inhibens]